MTEAEWLVCKRSPDLLNCLQWDLRKQNISRKLRLSACACCRSRWDLIDTSPAGRAIEMAEAFADGLLGLDGLIEGQGLAEKASRDFYAQYQASGESRLKLAHIAAVACTYTLANPASDYDLPYRTTNYAAQVRAYAVLGVDAKMDDLWRHHKWIEYANQCDLFRDIFGNPFRPISSDPSWLTTTVLDLARQMYESRDFSAMPILADALQDAGCDNDGILNHCRGPGPHVRGCWVVDAILGKS